MIFLLLLALSQPNTGTGFGTCPSDAHRHELELTDGKPTVYHFEPYCSLDQNLKPVCQEQQPDIVMDGLCHDNNSEAPTDPDRKVLPIPQSEDGEAI